MNIIEILEERARKTPEKAAVLFRDKVISFYQLADISLRLANSLQKIGVTKGVKVAMYLPSWPEYIFSYLAIWRLGGTCVPLDFMLTEDELVSCLTHSETKVFNS